MDVGLRHLEFAAAAAEYGSFRRAAEMLHTRQSTVSRSVQQLEDRLGVSLFTRSSAGVRPTPTGLQFLKTARRLIGDFDALVTTANAWASGKAGRFVLGLPSVHSMAKLRSVLIEYAGTCPDVGIYLTAGLKHTLLGELRSDALDLAIVVGNVEEDGVELLSLWSERIVVAVPQSHPLARRTFIYWTDLADNVVLMSRRELGPELKDVMETKLASVGRLPKIEEHEIGTDALLSLAAAGRGVTLQCDGFAQIAHPRLVPLEIRDSTGPAYITYSACWKKQPSNPVLAPFLLLLQARSAMLLSDRVPDI